MTQFRHQEGPQEMDGHYPLTEGLDQLMQARKRLEVQRLALHTLAPNLEKSLQDDVEGVQFNLYSILSLLETAEKNLKEAHD